MDDSAFQIQLHNMDKKLDEHGDDLREIRNTLSTIAEQAVQIANIQATQVEFKAQMYEMEKRMGKMKEWQVTCPRTQVSHLWKTIAAVSLAMTGAFLSHIFGSGK